jgi:hypothetical protein
MKIVGALFVCFLLSFAAFAQTVETENKTEIAVEEITLSRDDGSGEIGDEAESFVITDVPIHCSILLNSIESATVKMNFVAVKAAGLKAESKIVTVSYKTNGKQNRVNFSASPDKIWAVGQYRVDIFINSKLSESKEFEISKIK